MTKYRKKPVVVEATQFFYDGPRVPGVFYPPTSPDGKTYEGDSYVVTIHDQKVYLQNGDWILPEPDGEHFYPCKPEIFANTYEECEETMTDEQTDQAWVRLDDLPAGMVFVTQDGVLAVKSEYHYSNQARRHWICVLLGSGEYAHFDKDNDTLVLALEVKMPIVDSYLADAPRDVPPVMGQPLP